MATLEPKPLENPPHWQSRRIVYSRSQIIELVQLLKVNNRDWVKVFEIAWNGGCFRQYDRGSAGPLLRLIETVGLHYVDLEQTPESVADSIEKQIERYGLYCQESYGHA
jgi:hypothetical protein